MLKETQIEYTFDGNYYFAKDQFDIVNDNLIMKQTRTNTLIIEEFPLTILNRKVVVLFDRYLKGKIFRAKIEGSGKLTHNKKMIVLSFNENKKYYYKIVTEKMFQP